MGEMIKMQIGKNGLTDSYVEGLAKTFKKHDLIKISVLKSALRDREELKEMAEELCSKLKKIENKDFTYRAIGYTLIIRKWRKNLK